MSVEPPARRGSSFDERARGTERTRPRDTGAGTVAALLAVGIVLATGGSCRPVRPIAEVDPTIDAAVRRRVMERADRVFDEGFLWKPPDDERTAGEHPLAPLVIEELAADGAAARGFGALVRDTEGRLDATGEPTVYWRRVTAEVAGTPRTQWTYAWWYAGRNGGAPVRRGIRMTLDGDGFPAAYEALDDSTGVRPLFVSPGLDAAAAGAWGTPLPGRAYAVERSTQEAPDAVVLDLVEPGPAPLGPFVYLDASNRDVTAVICRCMPSRVAAIPGTRYYRLVDAREAPEVLRQLEALDDRGLEDSFRLPPTF